MPIDELQRAVATVALRAAAGHGYSDQAHLIDEFQDLASITPAEYLRSRVDGPNHLRV